MTSTHRDADAVPELADLRLENRPDGPGAAAILATGIGIFVLGLFTTLNEMSDGIHSFLDAFDPDVGVGPLSGKTILGTIAFFASWAVLWALWRGKGVNIKRAFWIGLGLGVVGTVLMFPPVFRAFI